MDVLKFKPVIENVMTVMKVKKHQREDVSQECYIALLQASWPEDVRSENSFAAAICRAQVVDIYRAQGRTIPADSLDDPRNYSKAVKIEIPDGNSVTEHQLNEAVCDLPYEDYQVIHDIFYEGHTEEKTADDLGLTRNAVRHRKNRGIQQLKKHFEVE
jgi:RNA polymerase sigma factor (sigma-70 family)